MVASRLSGHLKAAVWTPISWRGRCATVSFPQGHAV